MPDALSRCGAAQGLRCSALCVAQVVEQSIEQVNYYVRRMTPKHVQQRTLLMSEVCIMACPDKPFRQWMEDVQVHLIDKGVRSLSQILIHPPPCAKMVSIARDHVAYLHALPFTRGRTEPRRAEPRRAEPSRAAPSRAARDNETIAQSGAEVNVVTSGRSGHGRSLCRSALRL
jgi:arylamine N-acetyltransferase